MSILRTCIAGVLAAVIDFADAADRCATLNPSPPEIAPICEGFTATSAQSVVDNKKTASVQAYVSGLIDAILLTSGDTRTIDGVTWRVLTFEWAGHHKACLSQRVPLTFEIVVNPVALYLVEHPDWGNGPFVGALPYALEEAYPCPVSMR